MSTYFEKIYELHTFDFNPHKTVKLSTILNYLQDISTIHYQSVIDSQHENAVWVIVEWDIHFIKPIDRMQKLTVRTKPTYFRKFIAYRAYEILDEEGELVCKAISKWAYINYETRRQETIPKSLYERFGVPEHSEKPGRLENMDFDISGEHSLSFKSQFSDIDINQHVNNVVYLRWAIDSLPYDFLKEKSPKRLQVAYKKEVFVNEMIQVHTEIEALETKQIICNSDHAECVKIRLLWSE